MKLIVGLGNPGAKYDRTRHNVGFVVVDRLARRHAGGGGGAVAKARFDALTVETPIRGERCLLLKPNTFMNLSGRSVAAAVGFFKLDPVSDLLVIVDDVALPCGGIRLRAEGGAGGHNGLTDIQRALGTQAYPRLRVGVDSCPPFMDQADYVLGRFTPEQETLVEPAIERAADAAECFIAEGIAAAMNKFNAKPQPPKADRKSDSPKNPRSETPQPPATPPAAQNPSTSA